MGKCEHDPVVKYNFKRKHNGDLFQFAGNIICSKKENNKASNLLNKRYLELSRMSPIKDTVKRTDEYTG